MTVRVDEPYRFEVVRLNKIFQMFLLSTIITARIDDCAFSCFIVQYIRVFFVRIEGEGLYFHRAKIGVVPGFRHGNELR
jgi:hypothetical protein